MSSPGGSSARPPPSGRSATWRQPGSRRGRCPARLGPLRARALLLLGDTAWIGGYPGAIAQLELALDSAEGDPGLLAQIHAKLVNVSVALDPAGLLTRARAAAETIDPESDPAPAASVYLDLVWAETLRGHGEQPELLERWRECEERAGPDAPKSLFALIYFWCVDDFEAARARYAMEERWYRERGEDVWRAERLAHLSRGELAAGNWDAAEQGVEEACDTIAQLEGAGPWAVLVRIRGIVDAHRGRLERALATYNTERAGILWWEALRLSGLAFVEYAAGNHAEVDRTLMRMRELVDSVGVRDFLPDRSEPIHVESLVALGEASAPARSWSGSRSGAGRSRGSGSPSRCLVPEPWCWPQRATSVARSRPSTSSISMRRRSCPSSWAARSSSAAACCGARSRSEPPRTRCARPSRPSSGSVHPPGRRKRGPSSIAWVSAARRTS